MSIPKLTGVGQGHPGGQVLANNLLAQAANNLQNVGVANLNMLVNALRERVCGSRKLIDSQSQYDTRDGWGGCRRAVKVAETAYGHAAEMADSLGWAALAAQAREEQRDLGLRLYLIEQRARDERARESSVFAPHDVRDVLVDRAFVSGANPLADDPMLADLVKPLG